MMTISSLRSALLVAVFVSRALFTTCICAAAESAGGADRPNIVVVMVDDMGYSDIGCYGRLVIAGDYPGLKLGPDTTYGGYGIKWAHLSNSPFRYYKKYAHEGGIATPLIAHWPEGIKHGGELRHTPAHVIDIMATCLDIAGAKYPSEFEGQPLHSLDGKNLLPVFKTDQQFHDSLCWEHHGNRAVRAGDWKLVSVEGEDWELFDLKNDRTETRDLAAENPLVVRRLSQVYTTWSHHCGVLPVSELKIEEIPDNKNPLTREPNEMREFIDTVNQSLRKRNLPEFDRSPANK